MFIARSQFRSRSLSRIGYRFNSKLVPRDNEKKDIKTTGSAPAPLNIPPEALTTYQGKYNPNLKPQRVTYDYQAPPRPSEVPPPSNRSFLLKKVLPSILLFGGGLWVLFTYEYLSSEESEKEILHPELFTKWVITYKYKLPDCPDHYILELTKRNYQHLRSTVGETKTLWNGHKLWSVEICQPEINIVRSYTPLPLYVGSVDHETGTPFLKLIDTPEEEGKFLLYIKKYDQGEMARWLYNRPLFSEILLRGPYEDYKLPFSPVDNVFERAPLQNVPSRIAAEPKIPGSVKPDNIVFYAAGTGITPVLQMLYSKNPPTGKVDVFWSVRDEKELLKNFTDLNFILEKLGRAKFHYLIANKKQFLKPNDIKPPAERNYQGFKSLDVMVNAENEKKINEIKNDTKLSNEQKEELIAKVGQDPNDHLYQPNLYKTQLQQYEAIKGKLQLKDPSLAIVCGPDGYLSYVCGPKDINNVENIDVGPISGLLGEKGWDKTNVVRM